MTTIFERVNTALSSLSPAVPFAMDVYESNAALPDLYLTYTVYDSRTEYHADNRELARDYYVQVSFFCRAGLVSLPDVDAAMKAQGFVKYSGRQIPKNQQSGHYGFAQDYVFTEFNL